MWTSLGCWKILPLSRSIVLALRAARLVATKRLKMRSSSSARCTRGRAVWAATFARASFRCSRSTSSTWAQSTRQAFLCQLCLWCCLRQQMQTPLDRCCQLKIKKSSLVNKNDHWMQNWLVILKFEFCLNSLNFWILNFEFWIWFLIFYLYLFL